MSSTDLDCGARRSAAARQRHGRSVWIVALGLIVSSCGADQAAVSTTSSSVVTTAAPTTVFSRDTLIAVKDCLREFKTPIALPNPFSFGLWALQGYEPDAEVWLATGLDACSEAEALLEIDGAPQGDGTLHAEISGRLNDAEYIELMVQGGLHEEATAAAKDFWRDGPDWDERVESLLADL